MLGAKGHTNADLPRLLRDQVRHDTVDAYKREGQSQAAENSEKKTLRLRRGADYRDARVESGNVRDGLILVHRPNACLQRRNYGHGIPIGADDHKNFWIVWLLK